MSVPETILNELDGPARRAVAWLDARLDTIEASQQTPPLPEPYDPSDLIARLDALEGNSAEAAQQYAFIVKLMAELSAAGDGNARAAIFENLNAALEASA